MDVAGPTTAPRTRHGGDCRPSIERRRDDVVELESADGLDVDQDVFGALPDLRPTAPADGSAAMDVAAGHVSHEDAS